MLGLSDVLFSEMRVGVVFISDNKAQTDDSQNAQMNNRCHFFMGLHLPMVSLAILIGF